MATHSSILAWKILMDRGAWRATVHKIADLDMTETTQHNDDTFKISLPTSHKNIIETTAKQVFRVLAKENVMLIQSHFI